MSAENLSVSNTLPNTTPGKAQPPKARAAEVLAEKSLMQLLPISLMRPKTVKKTVVYLPMHRKPNCR